MMHHWGADALNGMVCWEVEGRGVVIAWARTSAAWEGWNCDLTPSTPGLPRGLPRTQYGTTCVPYLGTAPGVPWPTTSTPTAVPLGLV